ncbi:MAG: hypothetical protein H6741_35685, partial [Alphaproteobacteria bacterium]|nr:hypothetical protein [Alphaproteobacteria bacterium]
MLALLVPLASAEVFVDVDEAQALIEAGASVVDARGPRRWRRGHVPGSAPLSWWRLRDGWRVRNGRLSEDLGGLQDALEEAGVRADRPALVVGAAAEGWGEEGRILWTLEVLGHPEVYILDGGVGAWVEAGQPLARGRQRPPRGDFSPTLRPELRADTARVAASDAHIWDARSREEFL